jgi:hypothetical protein
MKAMEGANAHENRSVDRSRSAAAPVPNLNGILIALPTLFLWMPLALLISNVILRVVPPLRRVAERYGAAAGRPDFEASQRQLAKVFLWIALVCVPLIAVGWSM